MAIILFCNVNEVRVLCSLIPLTFEQCTIKWASAELYLMVGTVSSLPHRLLNVEEWKAFELCWAFCDVRRQYTLCGPYGDSSPSSWAPRSLLYLEYWLLAFGFFHCPSSSSSLLPSSVMSQRGWRPRLRCLWSSRPCRSIHTIGLWGLYFTTYFGVFITINCRTSIQLAASLRAYGWMAVVVVAATGGSSDLYFSCRGILESMA